MRTTAVGAVKLEALVKPEAPKAYSYLRFSTPEQRQGDSQRRQMALAEAYAVEHSLDLDDKLRLSDEGLSAYRGKNIEAGALGAFLDAVRKRDVKPGSFLLVESLDRISRQAARKALRTLEDICDAGVTVVTLSDRRVYTAESLDGDPTSLLMSILIFIRANDESATKARRVKEAWKGKRLRIRDEPATAVCPAWLRLDPKTRKFQTIPDRAKIVRRIFRYTLNGRGANAIASDLNREGVPLWGRGKMWHRSYIVKILESPAVVGTLVPHTLEYEDGKRKRKALDPVPNYYPPVIRQEMWKAICALQDARAPQRGRHAGKGVRNLFAGLLVCGRCGMAMNRTNKGQPPKGQAYVVCSRARVGAGCKHEALRYDWIEDAFLWDVWSILSDAPAGVDAGALDSQIERIQTALEETEEAINRLLYGLQQGRSTALAVRIREAESEQEKLKAERDRLLERKAAILGQAVERKAAELVEAIEGILERKAAASERKAAVLERKAGRKTGTLAEALANDPLDREAANLLMRQLFSKVIVDFASGALVFTWKNGAESSTLYTMPPETPARGNGRRAAR
jgi:DNA invertase Pin-like site-specific DNA recombinase